jgi:hypothetical protein
MTAGGTVRDIRILNAVPSQGKETDWKMEQAFLDGVVSNQFPESLDLREDDWWEIGDQVKTGSCVGWASTDGVLRWHLVKAEKIQKTDRLSVRFTWMAAKETDKFTEFPETFLERSGTPLKGAMEVLRKFGAVPEDVLPFDHGFVPYEYDTDNFFALASQHKIKGYYCLQYDEVTNIDHFKMWLTHVGPILAMIDLDSNFWKPYDDKKFVLNEYDKASVSGGHAIVIVGYTKDHFIIRNSWGTEYGDNGYTYASNDYMKAGCCEAYGVVL